MQELIKAFNASDVHTMVVTLLYLALAQYSTVIVKGVLSSLVGGLHYLHDRANQTMIGQNEILKVIDDKLFTKVEQAVESLMPLADDLKTAASDGKLTDLDKEALLSKAWSLFVNSLGVKDWSDFATYLIPGLKPFIGGRDLSPEHHKLYTRFLAHHTRALDRTKQRRLRVI